MINGSAVTITDLMVGADPLKDKHLITEWLDAREKLGFEKMAEVAATGLPQVDSATVTTLAKKYAAAKDGSKKICCGNAVTRSCAFTGSFVILKCGRRVLYPNCPGMYYGSGSMHARMCLTYYSHHAFLF